MVIWLDNSYKIILEEKRALMYIFKSISTLLWWIYAWIYCIQPISDIILSNAMKNLVETSPASHASRVTVLENTILNLTLLGSVRYWHGSSRHTDKSRAYTIWSLSSAEKPAPCAMQRRVDVDPSEETNHRRRRSDPKFRVYRQPACN